MFRRVFLYLGLCLPQCQPFFFGDLARRIRAISFATKLGVPSTNHCLVANSANILFTCIFLLEQSEDDKALEVWLETVEEDLTLCEQAPQVVPPGSSSATSSLPASITDNTVPSVDSATATVSSECKPVPAEDLLSP
ncbi:hypothetical protein ACROYT_G019041 [Oculina patagonica]